MPFPCLHYTGNRRFWTKARVAEALTRIAAEIEGPLPCNDRAYLALKKGRLDWPSVGRVLGYFGGLAPAWIAVGAGRDRLTLRFTPWIPEDVQYLLTYAGVKTLAQIAQEFGRTYSSVRGKLNKEIGVKARHNQGYLSAAELSKQYRSPYHRVRDLLAAGTIPGEFDETRNCWRVDLADLTPDMEALLKAPKTRSYRTTPPDLGDYYHRYGIHRTTASGPVKALAV